MYRHAYRCVQSFQTCTCRATRTLARANARQLCRPARVPARRCTHTRTDGWTYEWRYVCKHAHMHAHIRAHTQTPARTHAQLHLQRVPVDQVSICGIIADSLTCCLFEDLHPAFVHLCVGTCADMSIIKGLDVYIHTCVCTCE